MKHPLLMASAFILCSSLSLAHAETQTIKINTLKAAPQLDGSAEDWQAIAASTIKLTYVGQPELTKTVLFDVKFTVGNPVKGAVAVFDHDDSAHHFISETLTFAF